LASHSKWAFLLFHGVEGVLESFQLVLPDLEELAQAVRLRLRVAQLGLQIGALRLERLHLLARRARSASNCFSLRSRSCWNLPSSR
jgi:hypothetical protein